VPFKVFEEVMFIARGGGRLLAKVPLTRMNTRIMIEAIHFRGFRKT
jgi:hypothetical protein